MQLAGKGVNTCSKSVGSDCNMVGKCEVSVVNIGLCVNEM